MPRTAQGHVSTRLFACTVAAAALACLPLLSQAQDYPSKPVTMIVPFPPGGVADIVGRPLAAAMEKTLRQPVVVVNRPGAGGAVGMAAAAKAAPDGYTILMGLSSISIFPVSDRISGKTPPYELDDFAPIALVTADPTVLVVRADSPYKTLKDFVEAAKANPGKINYSSSGVYGTLHVAMEIFANAAGIKLFHVPYQGGGPAVTALLGNQVEASAQGPAAAIGQIRGGKMRALASWGAKRHPNMPDVPTFKELGYDVEAYLWVGLFTTAGVAEPTLKSMREVVKKAIHDPAYQGAMKKINLEVVYLDTPEFVKFFREDHKRLGAVVHRIAAEEKK